MALLNQAIQVSAQLPKFFETLRSGQAPEKVNRQFLKDIGFSSSNHLSFVPLLKGLGLLTENGAPTQRYRDMLDPTRWKRVLADAIRDAYGDIFVLKAKPTKSDKPMILGKYKSTYNMSDITAERAASTFLALAEMAGDEALYADRISEPIPKPDLRSGEEVTPEAPIFAGAKSNELRSRPDTSLHYNIQIHLPATKDIEVYNAIFRSLKEHLID